MKAFEKFTGTYLFQIALEIIRFCIQITVQESQAMPFNSTRNYERCWFVPVICSVTHRRCRSVIFWCAATSCCESFTRQFVEVLRSVFASLLFSSPSRPRVLKSRTFHTPLGHDLDIFLKLTVFFFLPLSISYPFVSLCELTNTLIIITLRTVGFSHAERVRDVRRNRRCYVLIWNAKLCKKSWNNLGLIYMVSGNWDNPGRVNFSLCRCKI